MSLAGKTLGMTSHEMYKEYNSVCNKYRRTYINKPMFYRFIHVIVCFIVQLIFTVIFDFGPITNYINLLVRIYITII